MSELLTIHDRIKYAIEHEGHTVATFARKCGVPDSTLRNLLSRENKPGYDLMIAIIKAVNQPWCDANWLLMGETTRSETDDPDQKKLLKVITDQNKTIIDQQRTIEEQRKRIDALTDKLLTDK